MILTLWALGACTGLGPGSDGLSTRVEELWGEPTAEALDMFLQQMSIEAPIN